MNTRTAFVIAIQKSATVRGAVLLALLLGNGRSAVSADNPAAAYPAAAASVAADHASIAQQWYAALAASQPSPQPLVLRLNIPRYFASASVSLEYVHGAGMPLEAAVWETSRRITPYVADCSKLTISGTADSGSIGGECSFLLPDDVGGTTNLLRLEIKGAISGGVVQGTFRASVMAARTEGVLTGAAISLGSAAKLSPVRGLPALDLAKGRPSEIYAVSAVLEQDSIRLYRQFRALVSVGGARAAFTNALQSNDVPVTVRKAFGSAPSGAAAKGDGGAKGAAVLKPVEKKKEKPLEFDLDAIGATGLESQAPAPRPAPEQGTKTDDPEAVKAMLPFMRAMAASTAWMKAAMANHSAAMSVSQVERGLKFEDPLFGPWYGTGSLASWTGRVNRLPSGVGAPGVQDWPFVHAWQSVGPFDLGPLSWNPVHLPECWQVEDTEYAGKVGPAWWKAAPVAPSGCAILTDLDSFQAAADSEDQPTGRPQRATAMQHVYFASTTIEAEADTDTLFAAGCTGYMHVWHDGVLVAAGPETESPWNIMEETLLFRLKLRRGTNRILVRCESEAYGLFSHQRAGTASYMWMRVCAKGVPGDPKASTAWMDDVARRKATLPNLPPNVRGFRGDQTGFFAEADPVTAWDIDRGVNVKWTTAIERWSKGAPVVVGDRVFVLADPHVLVCLDAQTGKILWRRSANVLEVVAPGKFQESEKLHQAYLDAWAAAEAKLREIGPDYGARLRAYEAKGTELPRAVAEMHDIAGEAERKYAAFLGHLVSNSGISKPSWDGHYSGRWWLGYSFGTPVTDGKRIYVKFHTGVTAAYDLDGNRVWMVSTPFPVGGSSVCVSPVMADDKVVIQAAADPKKSGNSVALTALDAATGRTVWTAEADSKSQISSPVVMRLTDGRQDMTVVVTDGGTVLRADDGKVLVTSLRGGSGSGTPTPVGDTLYRIERRQGGGVQFIMLDRDHVGARWTWHQSLYNSVYAGVGHHAGILFGTTHGGSQYMNARGLDLIDAATGLPVERPFNLPEKDRKAPRKGIFRTPRFGFIPPTASSRAVYIATRGQAHASSLPEELPDKWTPYTYVTVAQHGGLGRFIAHNKVVAPLTPHLVMDGDRVYVRNDFELTCFGYTGDEGRAYEAEVNAATILEDIPDSSPSDPEQAALWKQGILHAKPFLDRVIALKPDCPAAARARDLLARVK